MLILHAGFFADRLHLWGETPATPIPSSLSVRGGKLKAASPSPLPYDAGKDKLWEAIKAAGLTVSESAQHCLTAIARLPTEKNKPQVSSPLIAESPVSSAAVALSPWQVTALSLPAPGEVELLCACVGKDLLAPGIIIGKDLAFWTVVMRFAASLTARQRFLPGLAEIQGAYQARWEPLLTGRDCQTAANLAARMPPACRALTLDDLSEPVSPASRVLADFLGRMVDQLVRLASATAPEPAKMHRGRPARKMSEFDSLHDQWLHALQASDGQMTGDPGDLAQLHANKQEPVLLVCPTSAVIYKVGGGPLNPDAGDLALIAGWGHGGKDGVTMPGKGKAVPRDYTPEEWAAIREGAAALGLSPEQALTHLGESTYDIYLNDVAYWRNIPAKVWNYYIGGYQVMKKWLSYREQPLQGRSLIPNEVEEVTRMAPVAWPP